ncbi:hypothetical protein K469DRAFT_687755 [Zopfia rhizophila CBS 207.26]|uniref:Uncharacterized protein n=1 Tax=Zopfia rhizophila CBS 207.26 TaxID=1314779 RepID=A0A6A6E466_9PEZI|nr:hypothetical protein K469DRAFT_687755 [Zopfia rhizophila CBS 207.26]
MRTIGNEERAGGEARASRCGARGSANFGTWKNWRTFRNGIGEQAMEPAYVIDKCNLTKERLTRLQYALPESHTVDVDELNAKLRQISPRRSPSPSDTASTPITTIGGVEYTWEELTEMTRIGAYEKYQDLKNMGGRPSREINPDPGPCPPWKSVVDKRHSINFKFRTNERNARNSIVRFCLFSAQSVVSIGVQ